MRNLRTLRNLIREYLDEMAYGGMISGAIGASGGEPTRKVKRFHETPLYMKKATAAFKNFPFDVWIQPIDNSEELYDVLGIEAPGGHRLEIIDFEDLEDKKGDLPLDVEKIGSVVQGGGCVILSVVRNLEAGFLPTPWMMVHALFDSEDAAGDDDSDFSPILTELEEYILEDLEFGGVFDVAQYMTMASARNNELSGENDVVAELCAQEVIATGGVRFSEADDPEVNEKLDMLKEKIKSYDLRGMISNAIKGKVVALGTTQ